jgi:NADH:ubiquinone oxidoreductase subunit 4 (subunit M)
MLYSIILTPLIGIFSLLLIDNEKTLKKFTLITIIFSLFICIIIGILYDPQAGGQLFLTHSNNIELGSFIMGIDSISFYLLLLTTLTFPICVIAS